MPNTGGMVINASGTKPDLFDIKSAQKVG